MAKPLSDKVHLLGRAAVDLKGQELAAYNKRVNEEARRKDKTAKDVAQEALDYYYELINDPAGSRSPSEVWTVGGYSIQHVLKPALAEENRIRVQLAVMPSADVVGELLVVKDVQTKYEIPEYVKPVVEEPEPIVEP